MVLQILFFPTSEQKIPYIEKILTIEKKDCFYCIEFNGYYHIKKIELPQYYLVGILEELYNLKIHNIELFQVDVLETFESDKSYLCTFEKQRLKIYFKLLD
jgi:hypothetical protein